ncbi:molybdenum cofactor guanylyltransferase [Dasania sp. GY-MA-18]|uniref:Molybdenum cofactor guanylyltransferase n=1 Tax=Dasania phycosphaerae TaxID=2950436 RepID=A0A9J6RNN2_9GAMM|nr:MULTISPECIES: molybdenum cofactor guanylyltransferase MobA [Dasania]MCR8923319.1 molybdenum cofactor guanylyltransferase [Dasania sp. GY-MA-18]MCZ0865751.1 molybdenum cofactor guanylyltransferase [Dasania phycosphaerae]MCZ0869476.1 molybdenum cofactor guanylyltransferase [Dasania phycosphaerae]
MKIDRNNISAIILAGGQGRRFQYRDKGLVQWQDQPLISHVIAQIGPQVSDIVISCNRNLEQYQQYGYPCIRDQLTDFQGPLAGIASCLPHIKTDYCLICPCDSPILPPDLVARLTHSLLSSDGDISYVNDGERDQYLFCLLKTSVATNLNRYLQQGNRRVRDWQQQHRAQAADLSDLRGQFLNINSPERLATGNKKPQ